MTTEHTILAALSTLLIAGLLIYLRREFDELAYVSSLDINQVNERVQRKILKFKQNGWWHWSIGNDAALGKFPEIYDEVAEKKGFHKGNYPRLDQPKRRKYRDNK